MCSIPTDEPRCRRQGNKELQKLFDEAHSRVTRFEGSNKTGQERNESKAVRGQLPNQIRKLLAESKGTREPISRCVRTDGDTLVVKTLCGFVMCLPIYTPCA